MTPLELLRFFGEARELPPGILKRRIDAVVEICALEQVLEKPIGKLSRGYKQRVGLAQALLHDPEVLIMDEPTAGLDPNQIKQFRDNIQAAGADQDGVDLDPHSAGGRSGGRPGSLLIHAGRLLYDGPRVDLEENGSLEEPFYRLTKEPAPAPATRGVDLPSGRPGDDATAR